MTTIIYIDENFQFHETEQHYVEPTLAPVATSGQYHDLYNRPHIPDVQTSVIGEVLILTID